MFNLKTNQKRFWITTVLAWILFIGIDFLFHASLLRSYWSDNVVAFKPLSNLFVLIPAGYLSFFLLTLLLGYIFCKVYSTKPIRAEIVRFSIIVSLLFSVSNFFGQFSYLNIPLKHLLLFNLVYFVEIFTVIYFFYKAIFAQKISKVVWYALTYFFVLILIGIIIQNII